MSGSTIYENRRGLSPDRIIRITTQFTPELAQAADFGALLIVGTSTAEINPDIITRFDSLEAVADVYSTTSAEYDAALTFFSQAPQPAYVYIMRYSRTETNAQVVSPAITTTAAGVLLNDLKKLTAAYGHIVINGGPPVACGPFNFSTATSLGTASGPQLATSVCGIMSNSIPPIWPAEVKIYYHTTSRQFRAALDTVGQPQTLELRLRPGGTGTPVVPYPDMFSPMKMTAATGGVAAPGFDGHTPVDALLLATVDKRWYGCLFAVKPSTGPAPLSTAEYLSCAAAVEAMKPARIFGICSDDPQILNPLSTTDIAAECAKRNYTRTFVEYSSQDANEHASIFGRMFTTKFLMQNSTITMKFKNEPGVAPERLTDEQASTLKAKNCNVFVQYSNGTAIIQEGVMSSGMFMDERHGVDWFVNDLQNELYNTLYGAETKIPQTDAGGNMLVAAATRSCDKAINNGLVAPGRWNSAVMFGGLVPGQILSAGYYVYMPPMATQDQATRQARIAPPMQVAIKLAGAVHFADVAVFVNQ